MNNQFTTSRPQMETEKTNGNSTQERIRAAESAGATSDQAARINDAIEQMKKATTTLYDAIGSLGSASGDVAKLKLAQSKLKAMEWEGQAEGKIAERPLLYVGGAFALGWLFSRLTR